jgi:hypothetical protein
VHRTQRHRNLISRHHPPPRLPPNQVIHFPARSGCLCSHSLKQEKGPGRLPPLSGMFNGGGDLDPR